MKEKQIRTIRILRGGESTAYMDYYNVHTPNKEASDAVTLIIRKAAAEIRLEMNERKTSFYNRDDENQENEINVPIED